MLITVADAVVNEDTVVVHLVNAALADGAVLRARGL